MYHKYKWTIFGICFIIIALFPLWEFYQEQTIRQSLKRFKSLELNGKITSQSTRFSMFEFSIDGIEKFTFGAGRDNNFKATDHFHIVARIGDSIMKMAGSDTFTLKHKDEYISFVIAFPE